MLYSREKTTTVIKHYSNMSNYLLKILYCHFLSKWRSMSVHTLQNKEAPLLVWSYSEFQQVLIQKFQFPPHCFVSPFHDHTLPPSPYQFIPTWRAGYTLAQLPLMFSFHLKLFNLTLEHCKPLNFLYILYSEYGVDS